MGSDDIVAIHISGDRRRRWHNEQTILRVAMSTHRPYGTSITSSHNSNGAPKSAVVKK